MLDKAIPNIVLSPHYDDAAFSLGATLAAAGGGTLVNLFTRSAHRALAPAPMLPPPELVEEVSAERGAEDAVFAARLGLRRIELGFGEPALSGLRIRDERGLAPSVAVLREPLAEVLRDMLGQGMPAVLYCPAGIGGHVNHLATREVVIAMLAGFGAAVRVLFYEDLPYASRWRVRREGIAALRAALPGRRLVRRTMRVADRQAKLALVNLYASQHVTPPTALKRFSPAALWPIGPHEAAWEVLPG